MLKKLITGTLGVMALAVPFLIAAPQPAEARLVCNGYRCWHVRHVHYVPYHSGWHHHRWHRGGYYR
jgi:hypothetical protein